MRECIRRLAADRVAGLILEVDETNQAAIILYKKLGFKQVGSRSGYYKNSSADAPADVHTESSALVMRLDLG
jgi:ribosomal-protein-alanine N-acetyltransferase